MKNTCAAIDIEICEKIDNEIEEIRTILGTKSKSEILNGKAIEKPYCVNGNSVICKIEQAGKTFYATMYLSYDEYDMVKTVGLALICHHDCEHVCSNIYGKHAWAKAKNRNTAWNKAILYEDYPIYYNINEIVYIITTANGHPMPRVVECIVTGISIPMVSKGKKIQPIYHILSTGKDKDYSAYNTNIKYEASKNKVFSSRELAEKSIGCIERFVTPISEKREGKLLTLIKPNNQTVVLYIDNETISFGVKKICLDIKMNPTYELHRKLTENESKERWLKNKVFSYDVIKLGEDEIRNRLCETPDDSLLQGSRE